MTGLLVNPSTRQRELVAAVLDPEVLHVVASGPKRAGKSWAGHWAWMRYTLMAHSGADFGLVTPSQSRFEAMVAELGNVCADLQVRFSRHPRYLKFGPNRLYHWVSKTQYSHEQITGHTWAGCILDEASPPAAGLHP